MDIAAATQAPTAIYLKDYTPPDYRIERVELRFELEEAFATVQARLDMVRNHTVDGGGPRPLRLDGQELELLALRLNGESLTPDRYRVDPDALTVFATPETFTLETVTRIRPQDNTSLEGLYKSSDNFCTQCEAEGFRKITYFLDRPDVMAAYTTTIVADQSRYPTLLSNGNPIAAGELDDGRHWVAWRDPFKKPSYLFALVAGRLSRVEDRFTTRFGRTVALHFYVEPQHVDQCAHAIASLKKAMAWDEEVFGREYDLDIYMIVAVSDFNMGAMENKGLNIFNTKYVLARPDTATDADYQGIEGVIAHEYFHNWTGNRITCRDWFQLSLKEGLTVFRDQEFSADMNSRAVKRIQDVRVLRSAQFPQDASPMAHSVRPDSYIEINNFYTVTVYNKGAEVSRMLHTLLGPAGFRRGMDLYFERHDGQAVTCDDFVQALADANGADFTQFRLWYSQAGTPELRFERRYDPKARTYTLTVRQSCPPTPGQPHKAPFHIPLAIGLLDGEGRDLPLQLDGEAAPVGAQRVLELRQPEHVFTFINVPAAPTPSLLRGFSAPVKLLLDYSDDELLFLLAHDSDSFNRWEAGQKMAERIILQLIDDQRQNISWTLPPAFAAAVGQALAAPDLDPALLNQLLSLPDESYLAEQMEIVDVDGVHAAREFVRRVLAAALREPLLALYQSYHGGGEYRCDAGSIGRRSLKNRCLDYLLQLDEPFARELCLRQYHQANNMTDELAALALLAHCDCPERPAVLADFYQRWRHEPLVLDKWFMLQATAPLPGALAEVKALLDHPDFTIKNPNKVRALIGAFTQANPVRFHAADGSGYAFLTEHVLLLNSLNPQLAARLLNPFTYWRRYDPARQALMQTELERIQRTPNLSPDVYEIVAKSLDQS